MDNLSKKYSLGHIFYQCSLVGNNNQYSAFICVQDYVAIKEKYAKFTPHSAGRYQVKRFRKAQCPIVERLTCSLMMHGRNNGKKIMAMRIVKHAFEIIHLLTGEVSAYVTCTTHFSSCCFTLNVLVVLYYSAYIVSFVGLNK